ncbi:protein of unknown function [Robiginitalea myxolifaciens]|uniref:Uncharacterized protein n=1 Tax=Robiginitalea myxolifaciens TaxID=400055 RepID=A0A1I6HF54_9FLAO|nr:DUF4153 domain-containing protein [Robiginitalea myxolifaciens]SFR53122.1 protein of unknown function [Robiginitalea myxolifaciens]
MKSRFLALGAALLFSLFFYGQEPGLNVLLMSLTTTILLFVLGGSRRISPWILSGYLFSGAFCFLFPSPGPVLMHMLSFAILCGNYAAPETSFYLQGIIGLGNLPTGMFIALFTGRKPNTKASEINWNRLGSTLGGILISLILLIVFASLYAPSNPLFEALFDAIDFSFVDFGSFWFTVLGLVLFYNFFHPFNPKILVDQDSRLSDDLRLPEKEFDGDRLKALNREGLWGRMALGSLIVLLLLYLITDWIHLGSTGLETPAMKSQAVHQGVDTLILSVLLAMAILVIFFRGDLNFIRNNRILKKLAYIWLLLNAVLLADTALKNAMYINGSGLTFKRLGVILFLTLVGYGLNSVYQKIKGKHTLMFLIRKNSQFLVATLIFSLSLPWTQIVTAYNLNYLESPDTEYLASLPWSNTPQLERFSKSNPQKLSPEQREHIANRTQEYRKVMDRLEWQSIRGYHLGLFR